MALQQKHDASPSTSTPVGSDAKALHEVGGKGDFGTPVHVDLVRETEDGEIVGRPAGSAPGYSGAKGVRTTGVGSVGGGPGRDSGGDVDTDDAGVGRSISAKPVDPDELTGADVTDGSRDKFASGGPAAGRNAIKAGAHGATPGFKGDVVDHSGDDMSTNSPNAAGTVKADRGNEQGAEGEVSMDEASGDVDQGAEV